MNRAQHLYHRVSRFGKRGWLCKVIVDFVCTFGKGSVCLGLFLFLVAEGLLSWFSPTGKSMVCVSPYHAVESSLSKDRR
jgi:hypothetical protein